ncbi:MAG: hypothetical protein ACLGG7_10540 [Bacteriovoracia bacterium]
MDTNLSQGVRKGRRPKGVKREFEMDESQKRFVLDLRGQEEASRSINEMLMKANSKAFGRKVTFTDLLKIGVRKITDKDIVKLQEMSLNNTEKIQLLHRRYNETHGLNLSLNEFILHKHKE